MCVARCVWRTRSESRGQDPKPQLCHRGFHLCVVLASDMLECSPCMYEGGADNVPKGEKETPARPAQQRSFALN